MPAGDGACDREPQADAARLAAAGGFQPLKGIEHALALLRRNAGTGVVDTDLQTLLALHQSRLGFRAVGQGIVDQVAQRTAQGVGPQFCNQALRPAVAHRASQLGEIRYKRVEQGGHIDAPSRLGGRFLPREAQGRFHHALQLLEGLQHLLARLGLFDQFGPQP